MNELLAGVEALRPHLLAVALIAARLVPVAFLCPLFGGSHAPTHVKLGVVLALATFFHGAAGVDAPLVEDAFVLAGLVGKELVFGVALGLVASLPFDAARMGGRFIDLFRGSSAEAALPLAGTKEAATGDALFHLLLAVGAVAGVLPALVSALGRSFVLVRLGTAVPSDALAWQVAGLVGTAFSTGLALGAPFAALALGVDALLGLASRAAPNSGLQEASAPAKLLGGASVLWLAVGVVAERLQAFAAQSVEGLGTLH